MCTKVPYKTEKDANTAKNTVKRCARTAKDDIPRRSYFCKTCKQWHLTKMLKFDNEDAKRTHKKSFKN